MQTIFPILRYNNARTAIRWLCEAFGFVEVFSVPQSGDSVRLEDGMKSPQTLGAATQAVCAVEDPDAYFERARIAGATIAAPPADSDFGARGYHVLDLEGHPWTFGTFHPTED
jgi:uncharacterized glyoxalase superfamily protein PhnB